MLVRELRQGLRRRMFIGPFIGIHFLAILAMVGEFQMGDVVSSSRYTGVMQLGLFFDGGPFWVVVFMMCFLLMPMGGLALMGQELENRNHELLQMTPLTRERVVWGKFFSLWSLCVLTFISLMPYMIVRYFIGGMDIWRNVAMSLSVVFGSGMVLAGALAASAYKTILGRFLVLGAFFISAWISGMIALGASAAITQSCGWIYHINAVGYLFCFTAMGLAIARSRMRLAFHAYEVKPSHSSIILLIVCPIAVGIMAAVSCGYGSVVALAGMGFAVWYNDTSKKQKQFHIPTNIPSVAQVSEPRSGAEG